MKTLNYFEAKEKAKELGIVGYHKMKKEELFQAVEKELSEKKEEKEFLTMIDGIEFNPSEGDQVVYSPKNKQSILATVKKVTPKYFLLVLSDGSEKWSMINNLKPVVAESELINL